jgi:S-adenosylmethionine hydrolase
LTVITLTTDFGTADPYVGAMKGVIVSIDPSATIVDITHEVPPQRTEEGAFLLGAAWPEFPDGSIHVAIVDPGVGTARKAILLATPAGIFIGPDNGILSSALPDAARAAASEGLASLPQGYTAHAIEDDSFQRLPVSRTFHGRDIFAPAAGHIAAGRAPAEAGPALARMRAFLPWRAVQLHEGALGGRVIHIDRFGNLVTTVHRDQLPATSAVQVHLAGQTISGLSGTYGGGRGLIAYVGSAGYLEVGLPRGSAAAQLGAAAGDEVVVLTS